MSDISAHINNARYSGTYNALLHLSNIFIISFLFAWLLIDSINGFLMRTAGIFFGGFSLGEVFRIVFLAALLLNFKVSKRKGEIFFILMPFVFLTLAFFQYLFFSIYFIVTLNVAFLYCMFILIFLFFCFGYFSFAYQGGVLVGGKGFFFAGNQVGIVLLALYAILIFMHKQELKKILIITFTFLVAALITLTKTGIFGIILIFVVSIFSFHKRKRVPVMGLFITSSILLITIFHEYINISISRWQYFISTNGFWVYMTGGDKRWREAGEYLIDFENSPLLFFIGSGWTGLAEQDLFDLIGAFGIFGVTVYIIWIYFAAYAYKNNNLMAEKLYIIFIFFIFLFTATFAGHVVHSAMLAPFVGMLANAHLLKVKDKHKLFVSQ